MTRLLAIVLTGFVLLQPPPPAEMRAAVERFASSVTNEQRFDAVIGLLRDGGIPFTVERFSIERPLRSEPRTDGRNIVASFGTGGKPCVIGAHYDAVRLQDGALSHGAVDNAASSVVLIRIAQALKVRPPAGRVMLVWFDMEELGLVGSSRYVDAHRGDEIAAMVNLDINAYGDTVLFGSNRGGANAPLRRALLETCAAVDARCIGVPTMPPGDERSFVKADVPAMSMALLPAADAHRLALMMDGDQSGAPPADLSPAVLKIIHTDRDTVDKIDADAMSRVADFIVGLVHRLVAPRLQ